MAVVLFIGYLASFIAFSVSYSLGKGAPFKGGQFTLGATLAVFAGAMAFGMTREVPNNLSTQISQFATAYFVMVPVSGIGVGMALASLVGYFEGRRFIQATTLSIAVSVPIGLVLMVQEKIKSEEGKKESFRTEMELTNVSGTFGSNLVTIPVSPIVSIGTRCEVQPGQSPMKCNAGFGEANTFEFFEGFGKTDLDILWLVVWNPGQDCRGKAKCEQLRDWCKRRPDMKGSAWCSSEREIKIVMRNGPKSKNEEDFDVPLFRLTDPIEGLRIRCREGLKETWCKAHFEIAEEVRAVVTAADIEPGYEEEVVRESVLYTESLWAEMIGE